MADTGFSSGGGMGNTPFPPVSALVLNYIFHKQKNYCFSFGNFSSVSDIASKLDDELKQEEREVEDSPVENQGLWKGG